MTPELFSRIGKALYGPQWGALDFSADLGVAERTIRRWIAGSAPIPASILPELLSLCEESRTELADIIGQIEETAKARPLLD